MAITDNTVNRQPFTLAQLAHAIAKAVHKFYLVRVTQSSAERGTNTRRLQDMRQVRSAETSSDWWLSQIDISDLYIMELRHVSKGSWQPVLSCRRQ